MRFALLVLVALLFSACAASREAGPRLESKTTLRVENRNFLDMKIYILRGAERIRLGTVPGGGTELLVIPDDVLIGAGLVRFLADPVGSNKTPISEEIYVHPGEEVELVITN